jgi:hypothetical protein
MTHDHVGAWFDAAFHAWTGEISAPALARPVTGPQLTRTLPRPRQSDIRRRGAGVFCASVAPSKSRRAPRTAALGLAAAAAAFLAAGCSAGSAHSGTSVAGVGGSSAPALSAAAARRVFDTYVAAEARAASPASAAALLALVTGTERAVLHAALGLHSVSVPGGSSSGAYSSSLTVEPGLARYTYRSPAFYLPEAGGYPRFFVVSVTRSLQGTTGAASQATEVGDARVPADGPALMLFSQAGSRARWLLASVSQLPEGSTVPALATDQSGYIPTLPLSDPALLAQPDDAGALQAAVVDDGQRSAAVKVVAGGPLTTGMYQGAAGHADGTATPRGDVYQWELEGVNDPEFALRTADGGALVCYAMTLNVTVAVPGVINKASPVPPGPAIPVPLALRMLLPRNEPAPRTELQSQQTLSFAAIDPPRGTARLQVIAIGGGLTSASAS